MRRIATAMTKGLWSLLIVWLLVSSFFTLHLTVLSYLAAYLILPLGICVSLCLVWRFRDPLPMKERISDLLMCAVCIAMSIHVGWALVAPGDGDSSWIMPRGAVDAACCYLLPLAAIVIIKLMWKRDQAQNHSEKRRYTADAVILIALICVVLLAMGWILWNNVGVSVVVGCYAARPFLIVLYLVDLIMRFQKGNHES